MGFSSKQAGTSKAGEFREGRHEVPTVVAATITLIFGLFCCVFLSQRKMRPRLINWYYMHSIPVQRIPEVI